MTLEQFIRERWQFSQPEIDRIIDDCRNGNSSYRNHFLSGALGDELIPSNCERIFQELVEWIAVYLDRFPAPAAYRQKLWERIVKWLYSIGRKMGFYDEEIKEEIESEISEPICGDLSIRIVKDLHDREGVSKQELMDRYHISSKTAYNEITKLSAPEGKRQHRSAGEMRICGQRVKTNVTPIDSFGNDGKQAPRKYYTRNTIHPLFMQLNVMQVGTIMDALSKAYLSDERGLARAIALDIWCQLSDYCKYKLRTVYPENLDMFNELDEEMSGSRIPHFETEKNLRDEMGNRESLTSFFKTGQVCNITIYEDGEKIECKNRIIMMKADEKNGGYSYWAIPVESRDKTNPFTDGRSISEYDIFKIEEA